MPVASMPEHAREGHALGEPEAGVQLGAVESERLDPDEHPPGRGDGIGSSRMWSASGGPGASRTTARIVPVTSTLPRGPRPGTR